MDISFVSRQDETNLIQFLSVQMHFFFRRGKCVTKKFLRFSFFVHRFTCAWFCHRIVSLVVSTMTHTLVHNHHSDTYAIRIVPCTTNTNRILIIKFYFLFFYKSIDATHISSMHSNSKQFSLPTAQTHRISLKKKNIFATHRSCGTWNCVIQWLAKRCLYFSWYLKMSILVMYPVYPMHRHI